MTRLPTESANFSPLGMGFFFFGVVPVCLRDVLQCRVILSQRRPLPAALACAARTTSSGLGASKASVPE
jgi:hypothetical protein